MTTEVTTGKIIINNRFKTIGVHTHALPACHDILCIDFSNNGDDSLPNMLQHAILVPEVIENPPFLGQDRTVYRIPLNQDDICITIERGTVGPKTLYTAFIQIMSDGVQNSPIPHIICAVDT